MTAVPCPFNFNTRSVTLPLLKTDTRYHGMPRRYEDTKPAIIQNFTHRYIVALGEKFHRVSLDKFDDERNQAVKAAEESLWSRAEAVRQEAIDNALLKKQATYEKELKKQQRMQAKILKDELFRLEQALTLQAADELRKEKETAAQLLRTTVEETKRRCEQIRVKAVEQAKVEERAKSLQEIADLKGEFQEKYAKVLVDWKTDKAQALKKLSENLAHDRELAVACAHLQEKVTAQEAHAKLSRLHEQAMRVLNTTIEELKCTIASLEQEVKVVLKHKRLVELEVLRTRDCFQKFIDDVKPYEPGNSEYVIPPMRLDRTESMLEFDLHKSNK